MSNPSERPSVKPVRMAFLDIETSSLDKATCEIREIALVAVDTDTFLPRTDVPQFVRAVRATKPQDPGSFAIHKIHEDVGQIWNQVSGELGMFIANEWEVGNVGAHGGPLLLLGGHNIGVFDVPVLERCLNTDWGSDIYSELFHYRLRDTSPVARAFVDAGWLPPKCGDGKLKDICDALSLPELGATHRAFPDAQDEALLYATMIRMMRGRAS